VARILVDGYMVRYPLGGMMSWGLQYLLGLHRLGHEVFLIEAASSPEDCFTPAGMAGEPGVYGMSAVSDLLGRFGLADRWRFRDADGNWFGSSNPSFDSLVRSADLYIDMGTRSLLADVARRCVTALIDGEPGYAHMRWASSPSRRASLDDYDHLFTNGLLVGSPACEIPTLDRIWQPVPNPVDVALFESLPNADAGAWTTVMNWRSHRNIEFGGRSYGQKDIEFERLMHLPRLVASPIEVAVAGDAPLTRLEEHGWIVRDAHDVVLTFDGYQDYIAASRGELSVCKNVFVATRSGWFSDRSAAYLAAGRPVILQDTGFSEVFPTGEGLLAFNDAEGAAAALEAVESDYARHSEAARAIACDHLAADAVMAKVVSVALG
jgi:hypothetical protein